MTEGSLDARLSMTIRHIDEHNAFDKGDLIQLLKDLQRERGELKLAFDEIASGLDRLQKSPILRVQAE